ncbi:hypothetical protein A1507_09720 [Methylomonas koyamae]|uniref:Haem-binding uptake Tiki superfamily ChaN domain-containing protein n=1 Tax=Methylomonas koyamae TaxID=702114 RepID=A0A177NKC5_9GAMM|nr:hypothetical protein [Methylomonas koyamae]OAI18312.1 hypothetical protein A1507_09720 [Methylomonas koyamae]
MKNFNRWAVFLLAFALIPSDGWSLEASGVILKAILPGTITLIGETHQRVESIQFIRHLLTAAAERHQCLTLALEIDDSEQPNIDQVIRGVVPVTAIKIPWVIDHAAFRKLISELKEPANQSPCLQLVAIDTGIDTEYDRDEWMAKRLSELPNDKPILALLGGLHTLKRVNWTIKTGKPSVAEILDRKGYRVKSFPQRWLPEKCNTDQPRLSRFVSAESAEALKILNGTLMALINASAHKSAIGVIDGFVIWECQHREPTD